MLFTGLIYLHCLVANRGETVFDHQHNIITHIILYQLTGNCNCMCLHAKICSLYVDGLLICTALP